MSQLSTLFRLQQIDSHLDQVKNRLQEIQAALSEDAVLKQALQTNATAEAFLNGERKKLDLAENEVSGQRIKIGQSEAALYGGKVQNPKELQDLQKEIAALKKYLGVLEDRQLEAMLVVEEAEAEYKKTDDAVKGVQASLVQQQAQLRGEQISLHEQLERLEIERQAAVAPLSPQDVALYEQLRQSRRGVAVARIANRTCGACGTTLTPALAQSAQVPDQIVRCPTCGRILYSG
ncbi:MAG TPA: C4-type zinc ribbon domain-containing protein [Anaerolineales bacterium]|nr:C4-type zinc ribbon domain-containing protein [Anaerolineales bacterium]